MKNNFRISVLLLTLCLVTSAFANDGATASAPARFNGWEGVGPGGGDIRAIAIDPKDKNRLFVTTLDGQVYTSADAGKTWKFLVLFNRPQITLDDIIVDREDSRNIFVSGHRHLQPGGFMYSNDGGTTWNESKDLKNEPIHGLAQSHSNPNLLIAGGDGRVFLSFNKGVDWKRITDDSVAFRKVIVDSAAFDPANPNIIYIGTTWRPYKSTDGGKTWRLISKGMIDDSDVFAIDVDPQNPDHIVASACSGIYETRNGGELWSKIQGIPSQSRRTKAILRNPAKNSAVYAGTTEGFWMSNDDGRTWALTSQRELEVNGIAVHPDEPNKIFIATNNYGLMVSTDGGRNFAVQNGNFTSRYMLSIVRDVERANRFYATSNNTATGGGFFFVSDDAGKTWTSSMRNLSVVRTTPFSILQDRKSPDNIYLGTNAGFYRSTDRGKSWATIPAPKAAPAPKKKPVKGKAAPKAPVVAAVKRVPVLKETIRALHSTNDDANGILAATDKGLYRTYNVNAGWEKLQFPVGTDEQIFAVHVSPLQPTTIWAGTVRSGLLVSKDAGVTWQKSPLIPTQVPIQAIESDPTNPNVVYVGTTQTLYMTRDGGANFVRRGGGLPAGNFSAILINPSNPNEVFAGSALENRGGIFHSVDAGQTWRQLDTQDVTIPSRRVWAMEFDSTSHNSLLIGTHSAGVFRIEKTNVAASAEPGTRPRVAGN